MPWTSLQTRLNDLSLILAGPILRRVEPQSVSVWVALSKSRTVGLHLTSGVVDTGSGESVFDNSDAQHSDSAASIRIGEHLHLALVTLTIPDTGQPLIPQHLYSYNLSFTGGAAPEDLKSLKLLKDKTSEPKHLALGYQPRLLPTFVTPPNALDNLNILHTSCRKAHGLGNTDALKGVDDLIKKAASDPIKRPHQLFLTGDQVYADDIAMPLLPMLTDAGIVLFGTQEKMPISPTEDITVNISNFPAARRLKTSFKTAKLTSGEARCHAFSFGEYCALYLFYWSNVLWTKDLPEMESVLSQQNPLPSKPDLLSELPTEGDKREDLEEAFKNETERIKIFVKSLPNVRRLLANIPSYMMFDDHEVTDDWNLTEQWRKEVHAAPFGKRIIRNGLLGFALFQAWGNMPQYYMTGVGAEILNKAKALFPSGAASGPVEAPGNQLDTIFGLNDTDATVQWHFTVKSGATNTAVLDSRTHRELEGKYSPPGLIKKTSLLEQLPLNLVPTAGSEVLLIIATAPVLGLGIFEELIQPVFASITNVSYQRKSEKEKETEVLGHQETDMEAWGLNPANFEQLLAHLHQFKKIVFLSGDVHYGFTTSMEYWKKNDPQSSRFAQLTASAAKNEIDEWKRVILPTATSQKIFSSAYFPMERMGWERAADLVQEVQVPVGQVIPYPMRIRLKTNPVLLPTTGWPSGTQIDVPSDWSWRLEFVRDQRPMAERPAKAQLPFGDTDIDPADAGPGYAKVLTRHEKYFKNNFSRRINWNANIGKVTFSGTGATLKVKHQLWFFHPLEPQPNDPQPYMEYDVALSPTGNPQPNIEGTI